MAKKSLGAKLSRGASIFYIGETFAQDGPGVDPRKPFFWRLRSKRNKKIVAVGGEGFANRANAERALTSVTAKLRGGDVEFVRL